MKIYEDIFQIPKKIKGYYKFIKAKSPVIQKRHWEQALADYDWEAQKLYGYGWGDPEDANDRLGNYLEIKNRLLSLITPETTIMEIGSLGGKWVQYMLGAKRVICVDVNKLGFEYIKKKIGKGNIEFYLTEGDELRGISDSSIDVIFSMDTFVLICKKFIRRYFEEAARVLKPGGRIFLHLPCAGLSVSWLIWFSTLTMKEIKMFCRKNGFKDMMIDTQVITHGLILEAVKS